MKKNDQKKILFIGGHFTAAIAVIESLEKKGIHNFLWIGHKYTMFHDKEPSFEYKQVSEKGIPFYHITTGKLYRHISYLALISLLRIPIGFIQSFLLLIKLKPTLVVSFGGYLAVPVAISAYLLNIPVITHEQTVDVGLSNKIVAKFARTILLAWESSKQYFPTKKTIVVGNPIRKEVFVGDKPLHIFENSLPTILILGGNQGSHSINMLIKDMLPTLTKQYNIIHQCGSNTVYADYEQLSPFMDTYNNYLVLKGIWGEDIGRALHQASFVITRSGANTIYELAALTKKSICIPLPFAVHNEQYKNAKFLEEKGLAIIIEEKNLTQKSLMQAISNIQQLPSVTSASLVPFDAAAHIADIITTLQQG